MPVISLIRITRLAYVFEMNRVLCEVGTDTLYEKGKEIPLQAWTDPEGSRRLRLPDFKKIST
jgi:hypothetical protein